MGNSKDSRYNDDFKAGDNFFGQMLDAGIVDEKFIREIVQMFLDEGKQSMINLRIGMETEQPINVRLFAHKLKSSFLMFDMHAAHALAVKLENVDAGNLSQSIGYLEKLEDICARNFVLLKKKYL